MPPRRRRAVEEEEPEEPEEEGDEEEDEEEEEDAEFDEEEARKEAQRMTVAALRSALEELGNDTEGSKAELVKRLVAAQAAAAVQEADEGEGEGEGEGEDDEQDQPGDMDDRALLEESVSNTRLILKQQKAGGAHDLCYAKPSSCGICKKAAKYACRPCMVRVCFDPVCITAHMCHGKGKPTSKIQFVVKERKTNANMARQKDPPRSPHTITVVGGRS